MCLENIGSTHPSIRILFRTPAPARRPGELPVHSIRILSLSTERCVWNMIESSITSSTYLVSTYLLHTLRKNYPDTIHPDTIRTPGHYPDTIRIQTLATHTPVITQHLTPAALALLPAAPDMRVAACCQLLAPPAPQQLPLLPLPPLSPLPPLPPLLNRPSLPLPNCLNCVWPCAQHVAQLPQKPPRLSRDLPRCTCLIPVSGMRPR